ncbi:hypothetical protein [Mycobacteroides salmoniphilum]|uniref:Uncharacterized protein n=1 Tax=Mycobacteroides salmoniphilum TaxID=404941 RepID=A0A4R8SRN4_9MYCO|nr:hypothetical protein [Mycobacteroides salmoniphilum]TDZ96902.1 hypothetical protein CCUG62472_01186 [Mycobacteroides salmoniphilum]TEA02426.1 hypothetical protein CCUG60884_03559 [Mycobacteroides salmoniphilum]
MRYRWVITGLAVVLVALVLLAASWRSNKSQAVPAPDVHELSLCTAFLAVSERAAPEYDDFSELTKGRKWSWQDGRIGPAASALSQALRREAESLRVLMPDGHADHDVSLEADIRGMTEDDVVLANKLARRDGLLSIDVLVLRYEFAHQAAARSCETTRDFEGIRQEQVRQCEDRRSGSIANWWTVRCVQAPKEPSMTFEIPPNPGL